MHVGQGDMSVEKVRVIVEAGRQEGVRAHSSREKLRDEWGTPGRGGSGELSGRVFVGVSTHGPEQVAEAERGEVDYVAIGPVFATTTKANPEAVVGLEGVQRARELTVKPLVAIGGITLASAQSVVDAGADSVAVIGGLGKGLVNPLGAQATANPTQEADE